MTPALPTPTRRLLVAALVAFALMAGACSSSDSDSESANLVPLDAPAPGVLYVSTAVGDVQAVSASTGDSTALLLGSEADQQAVLDLAPTPNADGLYALVRTPDQPFMTTVVAIDGSGFVPVEAPTASLACLDPHTKASAPLVHETATGGSTGAIFNPITFAGGTLAATTFDMSSAACPRWTADRNTVATAIPTRERDPSSIVTVVQTSAGERFEIGFDQCGTTPTSFSPNDEFLALSLTCYSGAWENSGLYLVPVAGIADVGDLAALTKLGSGLFGRSAWYGDGTWIATTHADPIESQNIAQDLASQPTGLQVIELATRQTIDLPLADGASPFSLVWLESPLS